MNYGTERNPIYPYALRLCDVDKDVPFRTISIIDGVIGVGYFCSKAFYQNYQDHIPKVRIVSSLTPSRPQDEEFFLPDSGIIRYARGYKIWNPIHFTIRDDVASIAQYEDWLQKGGLEILEKYANAFNMPFRHRGEEEELVEEEETQEDDREEA